MDPPYSIYRTGLHQKIQTAHTAEKITIPHTGPHSPKEHLSSPDWHQRTEAAKAAETRGVVTFLSQVLGLPVVFCLRKPAVVDHRVGFFLEGSSDEKLLSLTEVERPLKAGSLLRRTWRGISRHTKRGLGLAEMNTTLGKTHFIQRLATED